MVPGPRTPDQLGQEAASKPKAAAVVAENSAIRGCADGIKVRLKGRVKL